jgi:non-homologous end joining protein Ku
MAPRGLAARPTWKGYLKISLVNIPIKVFPATDAGATLSFNQLHAECQTRIQQKRWCPRCEREVANTDLVKGYEFEKGRYGREYLIKVQPRERGLIMYTLRHANEIRSMDAIDELAEMPATVKPAEVKLAEQVIGTFEGEVDLETYSDDYQVGLREIIDAKIEGREIVAPAIEAPPKVVNLMDALRKSLASISATTRKGAPVDIHSRQARTGGRKRARA